MVLIEPDVAVTTVPSLPELGGEKKVPLNEALDRLVAQLPCAAWRCLHVKEGEGIPWPVSRDLAELVRWIDRVGGASLVVENGGGRGATMLRSGGPVTPALRDGLARERHATAYLIYSTAAPSPRASALRKGEVGFAVTAEDVAGPDNAPTGTGIAWGAPKDGLRLGIGYQDGGPRRRIGETVTLSVYLRNVSDHSVTTSRLSNGDPLEPTVLDAGGRVLGVEGVDTTNWPVTSSLVLAPGEVVVLSATGLALRDAWTRPELGASVLVAKPGRYTIRQSRGSNYDGGALGTLSSGSLPLEIVR
jgi:hypothetical protein